VPDRGGGNLEGRTVYGRGEEPHIKNKLTGGSSSGRKSDCSRRGRRNAGEVDVRTFFINESDF